MKIVKKEVSAPEFEVVEVREVVVEDMLKAERVAGDGKGIAFVAALVSQLATFDGKALPTEEVSRMKAADFFALVEATGLAELADSLKESSSSAKKPASPSKK